MSIRNFVTSLQLSKYSENQILQYCGLIIICGIEYRQIRHYACNYCENMRKTVIISNTKEKPVDYTLYKIQNVVTGKIAIPISINTYDIIMHPHCSINYERVLKMIYNEHFYYEKYYFESGMSFYLQWVSEGSRIYIDYDFEKKCQYIISFEEQSSTLFRNKGRCYEYPIGFTQYYFSEEQKIILNKEKKKVAILITKSTDKKWASISYEKMTNSSIIKDILPNTTFTKHQLHMYEMYTELMYLRVIWVDLDREFYVMHNSTGEHIIYKDEMTLM